MARKQSAILTVAQKRVVVKGIRTDIREAKALATAAKRMLTAAQRTFMAYPTDGDAVKAYRSALSDHIRAVKARVREERKLP